MPEFSNPSEANDYIKAKLRERAMSEQGLTDEDLAWAQNAQQQMKEFFAPKSALGAKPSLAEHLDKIQQERYGQPQAAPQSMMRLSPEQQAQGAQQKALYDQISSLVEAQKRGEQFPSMSQGPDAPTRGMDPGQGMVGGMIEGAKGIVRGPLATPAILGDMFNLGFSPTVQAMGRPDLATAPSEFKYGYQGATDALAKIPGLGRDPRMGAAGDVGEAVGMVKPGMVTSPLRSAAGAATNAYHSAMAPVYKPPMAPQLPAPQQAALPPPQMNATPRLPQPNAAVPLPQPSAPPALPSPQGGLAAVSPQAGWPTTLPKTQSGPPSLQDLFNTLPGLNDTMTGINNSAPWKANRTTQIAKKRGKGTKVGSATPKVNAVSDMGIMYPSSTEPNYLDKGRSYIPYSTGGKV